MQVWSTTTVQATLNLKEIRQIPLPWPPKKQRQAITHILGTLDDKIELNRRINETLEAMVRAIFKSWFIDFDPVRAKIEGRSTGFDSKTTALFPSSFQNSEFGKIPSGWRIGFLGDLAINMRKGIQVKDIEGNTPYIGLEHMPRRCIALSEWGFADNLESNKYQFCRGEILFGKLRPYFHKVGVAPTDGVCSTDILVIAPKSAELFGLVLGHLSSVELINYADAGSTGTKMPRTNWQELSRYILVIPPERLAASFTKLMSPMIGRITSAIHESKIIIETRDALLPKLLSGEILAKDAEKMARTVV
jgi:type I restriction enzyme S subunit